MQEDFAVKYISLDYINILDFTTDALYAIDIHVIGCLQAQPGVPLNTHLKCLLHQF